MRDRLIDAILAFVAGDAALLPLEDIRRSLEREVDAAGPGALHALNQRLTMDVGWEYYPPDPLARRIHHLLAERFIQPESGLQGSAHLDGLAGAPLILFANHLSYADANVIEVLFARNGLRWVSDRLTALAGPKVFSSPQRRFSSLCFGTVKVAQSADVSSGEATLPPREVARAARTSINAAQGRLRAGDVLLLFAEGRRSRTGAMGELLAGASRYLGVPGTWIVPVGLTGSEKLFALNAVTVRPARIQIVVGAPVSAETLLSVAGRDKALVMNAIGAGIAALLPPTYRGIYATPEHADARAAWAACSS